MAIAGSHVTYAYSDSVSLGRNTINCLCRDSNLARPNSLSSLTIDLSGAGFMSITQLVGLTQYASEARARGVQIRLIPPSCDIDGYLMRMNLYELLGIERAENFTRYEPNGRFVPMIRLDCESRHQDATDLVRDVIIDRLGGGAWDPGTVLDVCLSEVMDNISVHSRSLSHGIVGAQYYPKKHIVEICVADCGQGIVASMGGNPDYRGVEPEQLMRCALEEGYGQYYNAPAFSGTYASGGMGLAYPTRLTRALDGRMWVVSHDQALEVSRAGVAPIEGLFYPGTLVSMRIPVISGAVVYADQLFSSAPHISVTWSPEQGWADAAGRQVDVNGVTGASDGLW